MDAETDRIAGVTLRQYAELCVATADLGGDLAAELAVASARGVDGLWWLEAKEGWAARLAEPAVAHAFVPLYAAARARARGGGPPATLERYAKVVAEYAFGKDEHGHQVPIDVVLAGHHYDRARWSEIASWWTPRVNDPADEACARFRDLMQVESDRIFGIERDEDAEPTQDSAPASVDSVVVVVSHEPRAEEGVVGMVMGWVKSVLG